MKNLRIGMMAATMASAALLLTVPAGAQQADPSLGGQNNSGGPLSQDGWTPETNAGNYHGRLGANYVDQTFVTQAVAANVRAIDRARAVLNATSDPSVKAFAKTVLAGTLEANTELAAISTYLGLTLPATGTPPNPATPIAPQDYMAQQASDYQQTVAIYHGEANNGSYQLRTYAADALREIKEHLAIAQQYLATGTVSPEPVPNGG